MTIIEESDTLANGIGPFSYENWKAAEAGVQFVGAYEFILYTDACITGNIEEGYGPYKLINTIAHAADPTETRLRPAIVLRVEVHRQDSPRVPIDITTDTSRYHGGEPQDEIAALVSLCKGIRIEAGACTRQFLPGETYGRPVALGGVDAPILPPMGLRRVLPFAGGFHTLDDISPMLTLTRLKPNQAVAVVRTARLFQDAIWVAEAQPELAWLMLTSAIEVAAVHWRTATESPLESLRLWRRDVHTLLLSKGEDYANSVAKKISRITGATKKFTGFLRTFWPEPPAIRPQAWCQFAWDVTDLEAVLEIIYSHRSSALHGGIPFPKPMCEGHTYNPGFGYPEIPMGLATWTGSGSWDHKDTPMLLHTFEYIVRKSLLNRWQSMANAAEERCTPAAEVNKSQPLSGIEDPPESRIIVTKAWKSGKHGLKGTAYGLKVSIADRDAYFNRSIKKVTLELEGGPTIIVNVDKDSFWNDTCRELIHKEIGVWFANNGLAPWPDRAPPRIELVHGGDNRFVVKLPSATGLN